VTSGNFVISTPPPGLPPTVRTDSPVSSFAPVLSRNRAFAAAGGHEGLVIMPRLALYVITCLDPRLDPAAVLGLELGDAAVVRNAGGRVTDEVLRDIAFISQLAEMARPQGPLFEAAIIHHNQCGTGLLADEGFRARYAERIGVAPDPLLETAVIDPEQTVRIDVEKVRSAPGISSRVSVSGHVYDVTTGLVTTL
jgi:carbonic anhydrase